MCRGPLTMTSVMVSSRRNGSSGPKPVRSSVTSSIRRRRSSRVTLNLCVSMTRSRIPSTLTRASAGVAQSSSASKTVIASSCRRRLISRSSVIARLQRGRRGREPVAGVGEAGGMTGTSAPPVGTSVPCWTRATRWSSVTTQTSVGPATRLRDGSRSRPTRETDRRGASPRVRPSIGTGRPPGADVRGQR